jgi:hypothetical protein
LASVAWGQDFGLDVGCCSDPFGFSTTIQPDEVGGGIFQFRNDNAFTITELLFETTIQAGLEDFSGSCTTGGFFEHCMDSYNSANGDLQIEFFGVVTTSNDDVGNPCDPELGEMEGIPSDNGCPFPTGHFAINLNTGNSQTDGGLWNTVTPGNQPLTFSVDKINNRTVPEPSAATLVGTGLLLIGTFARRWARRRY